ncbi:hydrogen gas-evolving membrane-bound hydrogenase subunit E [Desulfohalovibrio reitneri]|uniref:hydrogen gas-evolving membrane-bound hydrogenase subunit E n=1 Tax=Desulfohalovibrio reitneri TaxID=1307759 RepID=UPI0004A7782E|nr:hydrogen gas-evolving membrane-bound hydrogenase subunit E [Desulfohalovibrio reitneri]
MKKAALASVILCGLLLAFSTLDFPKWGDPESPASMHVSAEFLEHGLHETHTPNIVTAILGDYRGFDTMLETFVVFIAGLACFFILRLPQQECRIAKYHYRHKATGLVVQVNHRCKPETRTPDFERVDSGWSPQDIVVETVGRLFIPPIQLFGLYVLAHGHYSPGGGFQGGVIFAASYILLAVSHDLRTLVDHVSERLTHLIAAVGVLVFAGVGLVCMAWGANFLDYGGLAGFLNMQLASGHSLGILLVETGVGLTVTTALLLIFKLLSSQGTVMEGL